MKKVSAFIVAFVAFLSFPLSAFAAGTFTASNASWDQGTQAISFDLSNSSPTFTTDSQVFSVQLFNADQSLRYNYLPGGSYGTCNGWTHCSFSGLASDGNGDLPSSFTIRIETLSPQDFWWNSQALSNSSPTSTPTPTPTITPTPTPLPQATLTGNVYVDTNSNGVKDTGENNYQGATVTLSVDTGNPSGTSQQTATTDANGNYSFTVDQGGNYFISLAVPNGYMGTTKALVNVIINGNTTTNFGIVQQPSEPIAFSDDFTDANGTALTTHNSTWQVIQGTMPQIQNNTLSFPGGADPVGLPSIILADQCMSMDFQVPTVGIIALHARQSSNGQGGYQGYGSDFNQDGSSSYSISLYRSQAYLVSSTDFPKSALSIGWHNFKLCAIGSQISNYLDNSQINTATDTTYTQGFVSFGISGGNYIDNFKLTTTNRPPSVGAITLSTNPVQINSSTTASASFTDADTTDTHTASWNWGDGNTTGTVTESNGSGSVSDSHTYAATGVYTITLTVTDNHGATGTSTYQYVAVYDSTTSFAGGHSFDNPATASPNTTGKVSFGISAKYNNSNVLTGSVKMNFKAASLDFASTSLSSLATSNGKAYLKGSGTLNGTSGYTFLATGIDGSVAGGNDLIRFQIKDASGNVVYDSQPGAGDTADPTTLDATGNIRVH